MQKKQKVAVALVILFLFVVIGSFSIVGTFAKYTSNVKGSGEARVAKWEWTINNANLAKGASTFTMDLFKRSELLDSDCTASEGKVVNTDGIIAPGTCGKFTINLTNKSEVDATYAYTLSLDNANNIPLEFTTDPVNGTWGTIDSLSKTATNIARGEDTANNTAENTIYWRWAFEKTDGDAADTALGFDGTAKAIIKADLTLTQVD